MIWNNDVLRRIFFGNGESKIQGLGSFSTLRKNNHLEKSSKLIFFYNLIIKIRKYFGSTRDIFLKINFVLRLEEKL